MQSVHGSAAAESATGCIIQGARGQTPAEGCPLSNGLLRHSSGSAPSPPGLGEASGESKSNKMPKACHPGRQWVPWGRSQGGAGRAAGSLQAIERGAGGQAAVAGFGGEGGIDCVWQARNTTCCTCWCRKHAAQLQKRVNAQHAMPATYKRRSPPATGRSGSPRHMPPQAPPHMSSHSSVALTHSSAMLSSMPVMLICGQGGSWVEAADRAREPPGVVGTA